MNSKEIQRRDQAGHTKLTLVTVGHGRHKVCAFVPLTHDINGRARLPSSQLDVMLNDVNCTMRGQTFTVG